MGMKPESKSPTIELHIEELVLTGFAARDRAHIGAAVERELTRLIMLQTLSAGSQFEAPPSASRLDAGSFQLASAASPRIVGRRIAQSVYRRISTPNIQSPQQRSRGARPGEHTHV
jgi:hypothetical protein